MLKKRLFFVYLFTKIEDKTLKVKPKCASSTFGLKFARDELYGCVYIQNVDKKKSFALLFSLLQATHNVICNSFLVEITDHYIFPKTEATTAFNKLKDVGVSEFHVTFSPEPVLTATQKRHNINEATLFDLNTMWKGNELPLNVLNCVVVNNTVKLSPFQNPRLT